MFETALRNTLEWEGGYSNDPSDPGGETKYGISKRAYPDVDIKALTLETAATIYRRDYWDKARCDELPAPVAQCLFDSMVNQGPRTAIKLLQDSLSLETDGIMGPHTISAAGLADPEKTARKLTLARIMRYVGTANFNIYGRGWIDRTLDIYQKAFKT
jgi:lysozyme family protein